MNNLTIAFPNKTEQEKIRVAKDFYHLFVDTFIETIKLISISKKAFLRRLDFDPTLLNELQKSNQSIQLHSGHFLNYEFMNLGLAINKQQYNWLGIYATLGNKAFDKIMMNMRKKFGTTLISTADFKNKFHQYTTQPYMLGLAADQNTHNPHNAVWLSFFGKKTPFIIGPEKGAKAMNTAIVMIYIFPVKRGHYKMESVLLTTTPNTLNKGEITKALANFLEQKINEHPSNYLWSHKRWKHEFDEQKFGKLVID